MGALGRLHFQIEIHTEIGSAKLFRMSSTHTICLVQFRFHHFLSFSGRPIQSSKPPSSASHFRLPIQPPSSASHFSLPFQPPISASHFSLPFQPPTANISAPYNSKHFNPLQLTFQPL